jgi:hypothetical protein
MGDFLIKCDEATLICDKTQYKEANFLEKLKLSFHLMTCKHCKVYTEQNSVVTKVLKYKSDKKDKCLTSLEKAAIKNKLDDSL